MRALAIVIVAACGGATVVDKPAEKPPDHVFAHHHIEPAHKDDVDHLYVEITSDGDHEDVLKQSASSGLSNVPYAVSVDEGGDVELHVELASLQATNDPTACKLKIFVMRLPQHDLLGIADGGAQATGPNQADTCISSVGVAVVRDRLPTLLQRQLDAKR